MRMHPDDRTELDALLTDAMGATGKPTRATAASAVDLIADADAAGRDWPDLVRAAALEDFCLLEQKRLAKRESVVLVSHEGRLIGKAIRVGRSRVRKDGSIGFDQALFSEMSWDEIARWSSLILSQIEGLRGNLSLVNRVMALRIEVPDSRGPGEAATALGTTVAAWIEAAS